MGRCAVFARQFVESAGMSTQALHMERGMSETTITPQSRIPMGMAWAILTVMSGGAYLAGAANAKIDDSLAKSSANSTDLKDFRAEVKIEFADLRRTIEGLRAELAKKP